MCLAGEAGFEHPQHCWYEIENFNWVWLDLCGDWIDWVERSRLAALRPHRHTGTRVNGRELGIIKISNFDHRPHWWHHCNQRSSVISHILTSRFWKDNPQICHPTKHLTSQYISMVSMSVSKWMLRVEMFWQPSYRTSITLTSREEEVRANSYISDLREAIPKSNFNGLYLT